MQFHTRTLLTIVTEAILENDLVDLFNRRQIRGWTIVAARGKGDHFDANENIQLELLTTTATAEALATEIMQEFGQDYALVQWLSEVRVLRADKF